MVLLRSLPEFSTMCINAIELLGETMNCKNSMFSSIDCYESSWCDSRDEVIESKPFSYEVHDEDPPSRFGDLLDTQSLSSSVHNLLQDSSQRRSQHPSSEPRTPEDDIFRFRNPAEECSSRSLYKLNRCTAWIQDDYSFDESDQFQDEAKMESVRIVHWEDRVSGSECLGPKSGCGIFRPNNPNIEDSNEYLGSCKLHRCLAWSNSDSSILFEDSSLKESIFAMNQPEIIHWDAKIEGPIQ